MASAALVSAAPSGLSLPAAGATPSPTDPATLVHPLDGTATGPVNPGTVGEFPGADLPFGMIQWSPDTSPNTVQSGGGYSYSDSAISGFSLTHLSGTGCPSYQDVPILPTLGAVASPATAVAPFSHQDEQASPGRYQVELGGPSPIGVSLAVTTRTGISAFDFPPGTRSNVLFKVSGSINPVSAATVQVVGHDEVEGQVTSGQFCGTGTNYTLHFVARFDRPFSSSGTWDGSGTSPGTATCSGKTCGSFVTFDTTKVRQVLMKVGISFVSTQDAMQNLRAEDPDWSVQRVALEAQSRWNALLGRIAIGRWFPGPAAHFLHGVVPLTPLSQCRLRRERPVRRERREGPHGARPPGVRQLLRVGHLSQRDPARIASRPRVVGDMVQSLLDDAEQGGWLPKWAIVGGDESQMNGDSADPIIADAYAMGVRNFDVAAALKFMVKGATQNESGHGLEIERQYLSQYLSQHYVNAGSLDLTSIDYSIGGSVTLEYAIDDFSIAQIAAAEHDASLASTMGQRAPRTGSTSSTRPPATSRLAAPTAVSRPARPSRRPSSSRAVRPASRRATRCSTRGQSRRISPPCRLSWVVTRPPRASSRRS